ncbi:hypothetical protein [Aquimarina algiphila]|uniref:Uncharacterized protein n=1 Tax=Aquimarina algiphila TaxID=2047982 RepID=A0A554VFQ6_9FLAO|nr:hypothetical protein [Aquimarina algiphila]TSE06083.1 hypothetical protein FOF46_20755 [Aquimarina algiphila]
MMAQLLSIFNVLFSKNQQENLVHDDSRIFLTSTHTTSGRILMIEEEAYAVWAYLLNPDKESIDFDGFLCAVVDPLSSDIHPYEITKGRRDAPLPATFANKYSYIKNLKKKDIRVHWEKECAIISIKKKKYLVMDINAKTSYSKALVKDCTYGKHLES